MGFFRKHDTKSAEQPPPIRTPEPEPIYCYSSDDLITRARKLAAILGWRNGAGRTFYAPNLSPDEATLGIYDALKLYYDLDHPPDTQAPRLVYSKPQDDSA